MASQKGSFVNEKYVKRLNSGETHLSVNNGNKRFVNGKSLPMPPYLGLILTKVYNVLQAHLFYGLPK